MVDKGEGSHPVYVGDNRSSKRHALDYGDNNYEYFEMIPDELVILIFTKLLISSSDKTVDTVDDIKLLAQCSILSKRFHVLVWQLPTLSIYCPSITKLYDFCPKFLKKFKHITSLQVNHDTSEDVKDLPAINWDATYRPHSYCLSIVSFKALTFYPNQRRKHSLMIANDADPANKDSDMFKSVYFHHLNLMHLHHMLVSSIKDLENLQRLVVTELNDRGTFILDADVLVELRNCSATNLEQVQVRCRYGCHPHFDHQFEDGGDGFVVKNLFIYITEWCEKTTHDDQIDKNNNVFDDDDGGIPRALTFRGYYGEWLKFFLEILLSNPYDKNVFHDRAIHALLFKLKCDGNLL